MLDKKYGMKYSFPHSVVHIIDNSMNGEALPVTVVDDPSLLATIVVSGAPMGKDREMVQINRSDILNVAYGLGNLNPSDINKYGQTVTYPSSLIAQNAPVRFMRVTPDDATYAFSCLLVQWKWDGSTMHVRFKPSDELGNNGLPIGQVLSGFKSTKRLNEALVRGFKVDADENDGWTQRVFMTYISAGRGKVYNNFNYAINQTNQNRRPANVRYLFTTIDTRTDATVERFFGSLVNHNAVGAVDATPTVNVQVASRVNGSDILVPTVNESAVEELFNEYRIHVKDMIDSGIRPVDIDSMEWVNRVYTLLTVNTFDPLFGRYIYDGDSNVGLPYYQVDMFNLDIPQLDTANRIKYILKEGETITSCTANPEALIGELNAKTIGVFGQPTTGDTYRVGDIYLAKGTTLTLNMIISINQYSGGVTSIPITQVKVDENTKDQFRYSVNVAPTADNAEAVKTAVEDAINRAIDARKLVPRVITGATPKAYKNDFVIVGLGSESAPTEFCIAEVAYAAQGDTTVRVNSVTLYVDKEAVYKKLAYPGNNIAYFTADTNSTIAKQQPGATVIDTETGTVYINSYVIPAGGEFDTESRYEIETTKPFKIGSIPTNLAKASNLVDQQYDLMLYQDNGEEFDYSVIGGSVDPANRGAGYAVNDKVKLDLGEEVAQTVVFDIVEVETITPAEGDPYPAVKTVRINRSDRGATPIAAGTYTAAAVYELLTSDSAPSDWPADGTSDKYYKLSGSDYVPVSSTDTYAKDTYYQISTQGAGLKITLTDLDIAIDTGSTNPDYIQRYIITGTQGSLYRFTADVTTTIPNDYYSPSYGTNPSSELGGIPVKNGYAGFFDDDISDIEFKWKYSELLVKAFRGQIDPRILSPVRCPAKFLFDGATNTIIGQNILPYMTNIPAIDVINASTIFTEDEKEEALLDQTITANLDAGADIDVKQAMYDLCVIRCYDGIPEDKRPIGPGSGLSLHLDGGISDAATMLLVNNSFGKRFANPNVSWDIGGYTSSADGVTYTYQKWIVDHIFTHIQNTTINKPFTGTYSSMPPQAYISFFPDIDATDWELRELYYNSGGNAWIMDVNGNIQRKSQRSLYRDGASSDLMQESNMRTLSQLTYLLKNKIDQYLLEYNDDGVLKTLHDEVMNMFSNWVGRLVDSLEIRFERDTDPNDGGDLVVCYCEVTFRGLILRVPIIVNVNRRTNYTS